MSDRPKQETVISFGHEVFRIDDIVTIRVTGILGEEYSGRIVMTGKEEFVLDMSDKYRSSERTFRYEHIANMKHCKE